MTLTSFAWTIEGELAGSGRPGLLRELHEDIDTLCAYGIQLVVTLTERPPEPEIREAGIATLHFPIPDMGITTPRRLRPLCEQIDAATRSGAPVLVHCRAGIGRTGMVLACCLVHRDRTSAAAIAHVRGINARYIQTEAQERFVEHYSQFLARSADEEPASS